MNEKQTNWFTDFMFGETRRWKKLKKDSIIMLLTPNQQTTLFNKDTYDLRNHYNIHITLLGFFNLREKVHICIYAYIDINTIYKSKKAGQLLLSNFNKQT